MILILTSEKSPLKLAVSFTWKLEAQKDLSKSQSLAVSSRDSTAKVLRVGPGKQNVEEHEWLVFLEKAQEQTSGDPLLRNDREEIIPGRELKRQLWVNNLDLCKRDHIG